MSMLRRLPRKLSKWMLVGIILGISTSVFLVWWWFLRPEEVIPPSPEEIAEIERLNQKAQATEIDPTNMFVGGNRLYRIEGGQVDEVEGIRLEYDRLGSPAIMAYRGGHFLLAENYRYWSFRKNGQMIGQLGPFNGYVGNTLADAIYAQDGDIWRSKIDWGRAELINPVRVTNLGYFTSHALHNSLIAGTEKALVYQLPRGFVHVDFESGVAESFQFPPDRAVSPNGRYLIADAPGRPPQLYLIDINTGNSKQFSIPMRASKGAMWLDQARVLFAVGADITLLDCEAQTLEVIFNGDPQTSIEVFPGSPSGKVAIINQPALQAVAINLANGEEDRLPELPATALEWLSDEAILIICDVPDSASRGSWFYRIGEPSSLSRLTLQPLYLSQSQQAFTASKFHTITENVTLINGMNGWLLIDINTATATQHQLPFEEILPINVR